MNKRFLPPLFAAVLFGLSCQDESDSHNEADSAQPQDQTTQDTQTPDTTEDSQPQDTAQDLLEPDTVQDSQPQDQQDQEVLPDFGFDIRLPKQDYNIKCEGTSWDGSDAYFEGTDADWLCTFDYGGQTGHVYIQATPVSCTVLMSIVPDFTAQAWFSDGSTVTPLEEPGYDFGGNHQNNNFWFVLNNKKFFYDHSSYGFGFRVCQPIDCMRVAESSGQPIIEDGCTMERTLPVVCVPIQADGAYGEFVDTFAPCPGDPNYTD